jgi:hypothetical protein
MPILSLVRYIRDLLFLRILRPRPLSVVLDSILYVSKLSIYSSSVLYPTIANVENSKYIKRFY